MTAQVVLGDGECLVREQGHVLARVRIATPATWPADAVVGDYSNELRTALAVAHDIAETWNRPGPTAERLRREMGL